MSKRLGNNSTHCFQCHKPMVNKPWMTCENKPRCGLPWNPENSKRTAEKIRAELDNPKIACPICYGSGTISIACDQGHYGHEEPCTSCEKVVETNITKRWQNGTDHHKTSVEVYNALADNDFKYVETTSALSPAVMVTTASISCTC